MRPRSSLLLLLVVTLLAAWAVAVGLRLSPDVASLLPDQGEGAALSLYARAFGGGDLALVMVQGSDPDRVQQGARAATDRLRFNPMVRAAVDELSIEPYGDPTLAWAYASVGARKTLRDALSPEAMRSRLQETRGLLLAPGAASMAAGVAIDPLRLRQIPMEHAFDVASSASAAGPGALGWSSGWVSGDGLARLVLIAPAAHALRAREARQFAESVEATLSAVRTLFPDLSLQLTGGHAIAVATEQLIKRDLWVSGALSMLLCAAMFALTFRRVRALIAVLPPLALGTLWTAALAGTLLRGVSAISVAFVSVVVGVGVDTGVHVYSAVMRARDQGLAGKQAASAARRAVARPTLAAAVAAAAAFASLGLSRVPALRQLGLLCAAGELLTAVAILWVTPELGAWLETGREPAAPAAGWPKLLRRSVESRSALWVAAAGALLPVAVLLWLGPPHLAPTVVAMRSDQLDAVRVEQQVYERFGGQRGQWVVLVRDADPERARTRADRISEQLESAPDVAQSVISLTRFAPSLATQSRRLQERDLLQLPAAADALRDALAAAGFVPERFAAALQAFASPSHQLSDPLGSGGAAAELLAARFLGRDDGQSLVAIFVQPQLGAGPKLAAVVRSVDPEAMLTGYARLDSALRESLARDLPLIGLLALGVVVATMGAALRRVRDVLLVMATLAFEVLWVVALVRWTGLRIHAYNALVIPVLLGITVDEVMFLLHRAHEQSAGESIEAEARNVAATALTTAAGFAALLVCKFEGLRDLGALGAIGSVVGLLAAWIVVPAGLRALDGRHRPR